MNDYGNIGDNDRYEFVAWVCGFISGVIAMFFFTTACNGQDTRWRLIQGTDSIVAVPLQDLRTAAGYRIARNVSARQCAWELSERDKELSAMRAERESNLKAIHTLKASVKALREEADIQRTGAAKWQKKAKRRNPIVLVLAGAVGGIIITSAIK